METSKRATGENNHVFGGETNEGLLKKEAITLIQENGL